MASTSLLISDFSQWQSKICTLNVRGLVVASKSDEFCQLAKDQMSAQGVTYLTFDCKQENLSTKTDDILGSENKAIFIDASRVFDANIFAAMTGTLVGGGVLFLLLNKNDFCYAFNLLDSAKKNDNKNDQIDPVLERVLRFNLQNNSTALVNNHLFYSSNSLGLIEPQENFPQLTQQSQLIEKIKRVATGHSNRPLVITANRGRGKSAALGIAIAQLVSQRPYQIIVSAPKLKNLSSLYKHLLEELSDLVDIKTNNVKRLLFPNNTKIEFLPLDKIIQTCPFANLIIIDEAAAVPVKQLIWISKNYNRIVFSTTSDGYEGNGKGFEIRFKKSLLASKPSTIFTQLDHPIRWSKHDELEKSSYKALLLNNDLTPIKHELTSHSFTNEISFELITKKDLANNESDLKAVFSLLTNAHYQTRPADLQSLLIQQKLHTAVLRWKGQVIAVALINQEGQLTSLQCQQIADGEQRLKGELLPQSLMLHFGLTQAGSLSYFRVMRIAVHPEMHNKGIGSFLMERIEQYALTKQIDIVGASFAATSDVVSFWNKNNFSFIRFGRGKDSSSGAHSLEVIKPMHNKNQVLMIYEILIERFNESFIFKLHSELKDLELTVVSCILLNQMIFSVRKLNSNELEELARFSSAKRGFSMVDHLLLRLFKSRITQLRNIDVWSNTEINFLVDCLFRQSDFKTLAKSYKLTGKQQCLNYVRNLTGKLLTA